jgi:starch phosphorylase
MALLTPQFSAERAVREYTEQHYLPQAAACLARAKDQGAIGKSIIDWRRALDHGWPAVRFGELKVLTDGEHHSFEIPVYLNDLDPQAVRVELYADGNNGGNGNDGATRQEMECVRQPAGATGGYMYRATVPLTRPAGDFTVRVIPRHDDVTVPLEANRILWQR